MADSAVEAMTRQADSSEQKDDSLDIIREPETKKLKTEVTKDQAIDYKLEEKLSGILCCAVCLDVSSLSMYQCTNGHLMCASCLSHLLADGRLKDETATCPGCRCEISRTLVTRNLAVEKAISELPIFCQFCVRPFPRGVVTRHETELCTDRLAQPNAGPLHMFYTPVLVLALSLGGCSRMIFEWAGPQHKLHIHESSCGHPNKTGLEILEPILSMDRMRDQQVNVYRQLFDLLSYEKVTINDLQLKPYRTDDFIPKLFYESNRFSALAMQWTVKARINDHSPENPVHTMRRSFGFQLVLKSKPAAAVGSIPVSYVALRGPFGEATVVPTLYDFEFGTDAQESPYRELLLPDSTDCNRLLSAKIINLRFILVQVPK